MPLSLIDTAPVVTSKLEELKEATPFADVDASVAEIVIVLLLTAVAIGAVPVKVKVSVPRATESAVPVFAATVKVVEIASVVTAVTKPFPLTVITGIAVDEPKDPVFELTVSNVTLIVVLPRFVISAEPSTSPAIVIVGSLTLKLILLVSSSYSTEIPDSVFELSIDPTASCTASVKSVTAVDAIAIFVDPAAVKRPCASTVSVDTAVAEPYDPAVTDVLSRSIVTLSDEPAVAVSPVPPEIVNVSPRVIV